MKSVNEIMNYINLPISIMVIFISKAVKKRNNQDRFSTSSLDSEPPPAASVFFLGDGEGHGILGHFEVKASCPIRLAANLLDERMTSTNLFLK